MMKCVFFWSAPLWTTCTLIKIWKIPPNFHHFFLKHAHFGFIIFTFFLQSFQIFILRIVSNVLHTKLNGKFYLLSDKLKNINL
jgi:hypothetical protein